MLANMKPCLHHLLAAATIALGSQALAQIAGGTGSPRPVVRPNGPQTPPGGAITPQISMSSTHALSMMDPRSGRELIRPLQRVYRDNAVEPEVRLQAVPGGYNMTYTFFNRTSSPAELGSLIVPGLAFPSPCTWYDFRRGAEPSLAQHNNRRLVLAGQPYPEDLNSPVAVIADGQHAVGMSLLYNCVEMRHSVAIELRSQGYAIPNSNEQEWVWHVFFSLKDSLDPGERRSYTLAVRYDTASQWLRTLEPYRDYFQSTFGEVAYERDPMPVRAIAFAGEHLRRPGNPMGFQEGTRPDVYGFGPWANNIRDIAATGYYRTMIWALSGLYSNPAQNYPFTFATGIEHIPAARQTRGQIRTLRNEDISIGLWWGRSQQVMYGPNDPRMEVLNPRNPTHVARALAEVEAAKRFGVKEMGLDAFAYMPVWDAVEWLERLQEALPGVKFVIEPSGCDVLNRMAATYVEYNQVTEPNALNNMILPGNETWVGIRFDLLARELGRSLTPEERRDEVERVVALGYVPVLFDAAPMPRNLDSAGSAGSEPSADPSDELPSNEVPTNTGNTLPPVAKFVNYPTSRNNDR